MTELHRLRRIVITAVITVAALQGGWLVYRAIPEQASYGCPGYAYDVTDRKLVAAVVDHVVVATALDSGRNSNGGATYRFKIVEQLKGDLGRTELVVEHADVDESGKFITLVCEVERIRKGRTYVLALAAQPSGALKLHYGPRSPEAVIAGSTVDRWRHAVRHQPWPAELRR